MEIDMFIAVLLVLLVMNVFMVLSVRTIVARASKQVSTYFMKKLEYMDETFEEKKNEIDVLIDKKIELEKTVRIGEDQIEMSRFYDPRNQEGNLYIPTARYVDDKFFEEYKSAKNMLQMNKPEILKNILHEVGFEGNKESYKMACSILKSLNVEVVYNLVTLPVMKQIEAMKEILSEDEYRFFMEYMKNRGNQPIEEFEFLDFINYAKKVRLENDPHIVVRIGSHDENYDHVDERIITEYDDNICEGMKIIYQLKVYDYSIYKTRRKA